jgi:hypothetical protein
MSSCAIERLERSSTFTPQPEVIGTRILVASPFDLSMIEVAFRGALIPMFSVNCNYSLEMLGFRQGQLSGSSI